MIEFLRKSRFAIKVRKTTRNSVINLDQCYRNGICTSFRCPTSDHCSSPLSRFQTRRVESADADTSKLTSFDTAIALTSPSWALFEPPAIDASCLVACHSQYTLTDKIRTNHTTPSTAQEDPSTVRQWQEVFLVYLLLLNFKIFFKIKF